IRSGFTMSPQLIKRLSDVDGIIGVKESSGDLIQLQKIKQIKDPSFKIFIGGHTNYLPSVILRADGGLLASAALFPELILVLEKAINKRQLNFAQQLHYTVVSLSDFLYRASHPVPLEYVTVNIQATNIYCISKVKAN